MWDENWCLYVTKLTDSRGCKQQYLNRWRHYIIKRARYKSEFLWTGAIICRFHSKIKYVISSHVILTVFRSARIVKKKHLLAPPILAGWPEDVTYVVINRLLLEFLKYFTPFLETCWPDVERHFMTIRKGNIYTGIAY